MTTTRQRVSTASKFCQQGYAMRGHIAAERAELARLCHKAQLPRYQDRARILAMVAKGKAHLTEMRHQLKEHNTRCEKCKAKILSDMA